jgi:hypothetical protein
VIILPLVWQGHVKKTQNTSQSFPQTHFAFRTVIHTVGRLEGSAISLSECHRNTQIIFPTVIKGIYRIYEDENPFTAEFQLILYNVTSIWNHWSVMARWHHLWGWQSLRGHLRVGTKLLQVGMHSKLKYEDRLYTHTNTQAPDTYTHRYIVLHTHTQTHVHTNLNSTHSSYSNVSLIPSKAWHSILSWGTLGEHTQSTRGFNPPTGD